MTATLARDLPRLLDGWVLAWGWYWFCLGVVDPATSLLAPLPEPAGVASYLAVACLPGVVWLRGRRGSCSAEAWGCWGHKTLRIVFLGSLLPMGPVLLWDILHPLVREFHLLAYESRVEPFVLAAYGGALMLFRGWITTRILFGLPRLGFLGSP